MRTSTAALVLLLTACSATPEDAPAPTPSQVLADIEAKRKILDAYTTRADLASRGGLVHRDPLAFAVRTLASAYRHRPGWQDSWGA